MPIKREHRDRYPMDWPSLAAEIKEANAYECQCCHQQCRRPGEPFDTHRRTLTIAHADSEYDAPAVLLLCLCAPCHLRLDADHHAAARRQTRTLARLHRGQMSLFRQAAPRLTAYELGELERAWPGNGYLETLEDGIDIFRERYGEPTGEQL